MRPRSCQSDGSYVVSEGDVLKIQYNNTSADQGLNFPLNFTSAVMDARSSFPCEARFLQNNAALRSPAMGKRHAGRELPAAATMIPSE